MPGMWNNLCNTFILCYQHYTMLPRTFIRRSGALLLLLLFGTGAPHLYAQNKLMLRDSIVDEAYYQQRGDWFKTNHWGISITTLRDRALSPLRYEGVGLFYNGHRYKFKPRTFVNQQWLVESVVFFDDQEEIAPLVRNSVEFVHARHLPVPLSSFTKLYVGGYVNGLLNLKSNLANTNNVLSYELATSIGPSAMVQLPLRTFGQRWVFSNELHFPVMSLLSNTPYAWPLPTTFEEGGRLGDAFVVGSWGRLFRLSNQINVDVHRAVRHRGKKVSQRAYRFSYRWEFVSVAEPNLYQAGTHLISLTRILPYHP